MLIKKMEKKNACAFIPTFWIHYLASLWMLKSDYGILYANWNENKLFLLLLDTYRKHKKTQSAEWLKERQNMRIL